MIPIRTILVDDEKPARDRLRGLLDEFGDVEIVAEARDGDRAVEAISGAAPDLVFLDIEMPGLNGMQVAASIPPPRPRIVFCTAFDHYAIDAFEQHATDYLLKPVNRKRLARALDRVRVSMGPGREIDDATKAQERMRPRHSARGGRLDYAGLCRPARGVGGDYYDFLPLAGDRFGLALGDVSGKGIFAGLLMAALQARVQTFAPICGLDPDRLMREINSSMHASTESNRYASLFYGVYDGPNRLLHYVNAGHLPPLVLRHGRNGYGASPVAERLPVNGTVVGLLDDARYETARVRLDPGDVLVAFSDGLTEALGRNGEEFGEARVEAIAVRAAAPTAADLLDAILADLERFTEGVAPHDDLTVVVARAR